MILLILLLTLLGICLLHLTLLSKSNRNRLLLILPVLCPADHNLHSLSCLIILQFSNQIRTTGNRHTVKLDNHVTWEMGKAMLAICAVLIVLYVGFVAIMNQIKLEHGESIENRFERLDAKMRVKTPKLK